LDFLDTFAVDVVSFALSGRQLLVVFDFLVDTTEYPNVFAAVDAVTRVSGGRGDRVRNEQ